MNFSYIDYSISSHSLDIFVSGCLPPYCNGCCNMELTEFNVGSDWKEHTGNIMKYLKEYSGLIDNIFLLGGSFNHQNITSIELFFEFLEKNKIEKDVYLFAREELSDIQDIFKEKCSYIKCGAYLPELTCSNNISRDITLATSNQKIYVKNIDY